MAADMRAPARADYMSGMASLAGSVKGAQPMFRAADMRATVEWYAALGFTVADQYEDCGELRFARVSFGGGSFTLSADATGGPRDVSLWFFTTQVEELYTLLKNRPDLTFAEQLYEPFYGGRQFGIYDPNGLELIFWHPPWLA